MSALSAYARNIADDIPLIILRPQKGGNLFSVRESLGFHGRVRQVDGNQSPNDHSKGSNGNVEDSPRCEFGICEAYTIGNEPAEDLREGVADVEPRYAAALFTLFVPHCNDQD